MTGPSQWGIADDSGRSPRRLEPNHAAASYPLAESGILFDMVGSDHKVPGGALASRRENADAAATPGSFLVAAVAIAACGVAIGAFVASLALGYQVKLENGQLMPSVSWLHSFRDWLPWLCIGFGLSGLVAYRQGARIALRGLGIAAVFLLATWLAWAGPGQEWLSGYVACVIGAVFGLHRESMRRLGATGVVIAGAVAAIASFAVLAAPAAIGNISWCAADVLGVGLCAALVAFLLEAPSFAVAPRVGGHWRLALLGWVSVALVAGYILVRATAEEWVMLSAVLAVVITAAVAGRLALALGATLATALLASGSLGDLLSPSVISSGSVGQVSGKLGGQTDRHPPVRILRTEGSAEAVYVRSSQELQLRLAGEVVAAAGPDRSEEPLLKAILHAVVRDGDRVLLFGNGTGRVGASLLKVGRCEVECATTWSELAVLQSAVQVDGPVQPPHVALQPRPAKWRKSLADIPVGSRQVIVLGELPTLATSHRATQAFQRQLRRVIGDGVVCQSIALDRISVSLLDDWLAAVGQVHPWSGIYAVGNAAVLVSASQKPIWRDGFLGWSDEARWAMHEAHLIGPDDLEVAYLGELQPDSPSVPSSLSGGNIAHQLLRRLALPEASQPLWKASLLRRWQSQFDNMVRAKNRFLTLANDAAGRAEAQAIAARFLPTGAPAPWLQAALGVAGDDGVTLREPGLASRCAYAMDPAFFVAPAAWRNCRNGGTAGMVSITCCKFPYRYTYHDIYI